VKYRWQIEPQVPVPDLTVLAERTGLHPIIVRLLHARGYTTPAAIDEFIAPDLSTGHDPWLLADMEPAVEKIMEVVRSGGRIRIHGDYDVDGVSASALLVRVIASLGGEADAYIPHRTEEGYGLNAEAVRTAHGDQIDLLITVDCGISSIAEAALARELGLDLIITDHHTPGPELPDALAVINPHRVDCRYPFTDLCGVGIAYKVACALAPPTEGPSLLEYLDLVALGTTADVVPLLGENRVFVKYGLPQMRRTLWPGLAALIDRVGLTTGEITAGQVVFTLAPRINAAGRMADAGDALQLLLTDDPFDAAELARRLDERNTERREADAVTLERAVEMVEEQGGVGDRYALVLCSERWHPGVIGIVASRLVERYHLPTVLVALEGDQGRGSARSIEGFDLYDALSECSDFLTEFGGHPYAAGLNICRDRLDEFTQAFEGVARKHLVDNDIGPTLKVDCEVAIDDLTQDLLTGLKRLEPFGARNRRPVFLTRNARLAAGARRVGSDGCHLKMQVKSENGRPIDAIGFNLGERIDETERGEVDLVFAFEENEFRGITRPQLRLRDLRPSAP